MAIRTAEELLGAGDIGHCELVRGELRLMIPPSYRHGEIAAELAFRLKEHVRSRRLGTVVVEAGFLLARDPDTVRAPDVGFVRADRSKGPDRGYYDGAPDLVVEVVSPDDRPGYVREKTTEWLEAGARAVWVVNPRDHTVTVHEPERAPTVLEETNRLRGGAALPGFELAVREIFVPI